MTPRGIRSTIGVGLTAIVLFALGTIPSPAAQAAGCPDNGYRSTPGERIKGPDSATIYLVDPDGFKRQIADAATYNYFFRDWNGIKTRTDINCIISSDLALSYPQSSLAHDGHGAYYFVEPAVDYYHRPTVQYRWISTGAVYDKYYFRWEAANYNDPGWIADHPGGWWG